MPRLSDKHIAAIRAAAEDCEMRFGFGDVILLCDELQDRRGTGPGAPTQALADQLLGRLGEGYDIHEWQKQELLKYLGPQSQAPALDKTSATDLVKEVIKCVEESEPLRDADVLALFHTLQRQGYFQTMVTVNKDALYKVLCALGNIQQGHLIREMVATRGMPSAAGQPSDNPIDILSNDFKQGYSHAPAQPN